MFLTVKGFNMNYLPKTPENIPIFVKLPNEYAGLTIGSVYTNSDGTFTWQGPLPRAQGDLENNIREKKVQRASGLSNKGGHLFLGHWKHVRNPLNRATDC